MKEMSLSHSEPFHFMEFRHGPKSMITKSSMVVGLRSTVHGQHEPAVLADVAALGGRILDIAEADSRIHFDSGLDEAISSILYLPAGQLIALERSLAKGLNPDRPNNLDTIVKL
jgi:glucosamine--fructose-6-phosphate aminotransferase (isomerizing)